MASLCRSMVGTWPVDAGVELCLTDETLVWVKRGWRTNGRKSGELPRLGPIAERIRPRIKRQVRYNLRSKLFVTKTNVGYP